MNQKTKNTPSPPFLLSPFRHSKWRRILSISPFASSFSFAFTYSFTSSFSFTFTFVFPYSFALSSAFAFLLPPTFAAAASFDLSGEGEEIGIFIFDRAGERFCEKKPVSVRRSIPAAVTTRSCRAIPWTRPALCRGPLSPPFARRDAQIGNLRQISTNAANRVGKRLQVCYTCPAECGGEKRAFRGKGRQKDEQGIERGTDGKGAFGYPRKTVS